MFSHDTLDIPGDHAFYFASTVGQIEALLTVPDHPKPNLMALIGHPHSLHGGTMHNKVVTTVAKAFKEKGIRSIRFNFRGVGQSAGAYDAGIGESQDMCDLALACQAMNPASQFFLAGFSFGSFVAYRAAAQISPVLSLITIAPAINHYDYMTFTNRPKNWHVIQGDADTVVSPTEVMRFANAFVTPLPLYVFEKTGHFFHGQLIALNETIQKIIDDTLIEPN